MKTIRISDEVWSAIVKAGKFMETPDDVLKRLLKLPGRTEQASIGRKRKAERPMRTQVISDKLTILFKDDGTSKSWTLPPKDNKQEIRRVRDEAVQFAQDNGATVPGQVNAVKKAFSDNGYYVR